MSPTPPRPTPASLQGLLPLLSLTWTLSQLYHPPPTPPPPYPPPTTPTLPPPALSKKTPACRAVIPPHTQTVACLVLPQSCLGFGE